MKALIRRLPLSAEITIVIALAFGLFCAISIGSLISSQSDDPRALSGADLTALVIYEAVTFLLVAIFLFMRGWTLSAIGLAPSLRQTVTGLGIAIAAFVTYAGLSVLLQSAPVAEATATAPVASDLTLSAIMLLSIVNAIYEEVLVCGYLVSAITEQRNALIAVLASATLRAVYHLYQGPLAALFIGVLGLAFALYYVHSGRLWPLIVAHGILDFAALYPSVSA